MRLKVLIASLALTGIAIGFWVWFTQPVDLSGAFRNASSIRVSMVDSTHYDDKTQSGAFVVSYRIDTEEGRLRLNNAVASIIDFRDSAPPASCWNPEITLFDEAQQEVGTLEVHYKGVMYRTRGKWYQGTLPDTSFYEDLLSCKFAGKRPSDVVREPFR